MSNTTCTYSTLPPIPANLTSERIFNTKEAAEYLRVTTARTVLSFITGDRPNKLKASWVGRQWLITQASLNEFIADNQRSESQIR